MTKLWKNDKRKYSRYSEMENKLISLGFNMSNITKALESYQKEGLLVHDKNNDEITFL